MLAGVIGTVNDAQRDASRGIVSAIDRAQRAIVDTLRELVDEGRETRKEIRRLQGEQARVA